jgi:hypothetical protein
MSIQWIPSWCLLNTTPLPRLTGCRHYATKNNNTYKANFLKLLGLLFLYLKCIRKVWRNGRKEDWKSEGCRFEIRRCCFWYISVRSKKFDICENLPKKLDIYCKIFLPRSGCRTFPSTFFTVYSLSWILVCNVQYVEGTVTWDGFCHTFLCRIKNLGFRILILLV